MGCFLGIDGTIGLLLGVLSVSCVLGFLLTFSGVAWGNAKKYMELSDVDQIGSSAHIAAMVGDALGDAFKDVAAPSMNILIKLMGIVAILTCFLSLIFERLIL